MPANVNPNPGLSPAEVQRLTRRETADNPEASYQQRRRYAGEQPKPGISYAPRPDGAEAKAMAERIGMADATLLGSIASLVEFDTLWVRRKVVSERLKMLARHLKEQERITAAVKGSEYFTLSAQTQATIREYNDYGTPYAQGAFAELQNKLEDAVKLATQTAAERDYWREKAERGQLQHEADSLVASKLVEQLAADLAELEDENDRLVAQSGGAEDDGGESEIVVVYVRSDTPIEGGITPELLSEIRIAIGEPGFVG